VTAIVDRSRVPLMTRAEIGGLLAMLAHYDGHAPGESDLFWWRDQLAGYTAPECQAAIWALSKTNPKRITPGDIIAQIKGARRVVEARTPRRPTNPAADRSKYAGAARRGMTALYARMSWQRAPEQAAGLTVPCPIAACAAPAGVICANVNRPEARDRATRMHPSRVQAGRDAAGATSQEVPT
jgi:hypothetical protein